MSHGYQDLIVWQRAMDLAEQIYGETAKFPDQERYGLTAQVRRAAVSIPSNIAEGNARNSDRDFGRFLEIALGSLAEAETQIILAGRLKYLASASCTKLLEQAAEVGRLLAGLYRAKSKKL